MSIETGGTLSHFKDTTIEIGKNALNFSKRSVKPGLYILGTAGILAGTLNAANHLKEEKEIRASIAAQVNKASREASEGQYKLAQDNQPTENTHLLQASQLKDQLTKEYKAKVGHRRIIDAAIIALSFAAFSTPSLNDKIINKLKRRKRNATLSNK